MLHLLKFFIVCTYSVDILDKGMIHVPGGTEQDGARFHHGTLNSMQFKTHESFISGTSHLRVLELS